MTWPTDEEREAVAQDAVVTSGALNDVLAVVRSRSISIEDAWAVLAAALPGVVRAERAAALREVAAGFRENAEKMRARGGYSAGTSAPRHQMCDEVADVLEHEARRIERGGSDA